MKYLKLTITGHDIFLRYDSEKKISVSVSINAEATIIVKAKMTVEQFEETKLEADSFSPITESQFETAYYNALNDLLKFT